MTPMKILACLVLCLSSFAFAQSSPKTGVKFACICEDAVGARLATAVRDLIAVSPRYKSVADFQIGKPPKITYNWGIRVVSLDPSKSETDAGGRSTVISFVITLGPIYFFQGVETCGLTKVQDCAEDLIADLDRQVSE